MRLAKCSRMLLCTFAALMGVSSVQASDTPPKPLLDDQVAMNIAIRLARRAAPGHAYSGQVIGFEPSAREWIMPIDAGLDANMAKHFVARLNESTGLACLELPPAAGCVVQEDIRRTLDDAKVKAEALAMAKAYPAPDLQNMAEVLLRHELIEERSRDRYPSQVRVFVSLPSPDAKGLVDFSPDIVARFMQVGIDVYPGRAWKDDGGSAGANWRFEIGLPVRRPDGNYDVPYSYNCGALCRAWLKAVMKRDAAGWHLVSAVMTAIS